MMGNLSTLYHPEHLDALTQLLRHCLRPHESPTALASAVASAAVCWTLGAFMMAFLVWYARETRFVL